MIEGREFAQERLLDAAGHVMHAYFKAPEVTGRLNRKALLVAGDEFAPMLEFLERLQEKLGPEAMKDTFFPMYVDYMCFKTAIDEGRPPVVLVLGADLGAGDLAWDCGACGFGRCADFNRYKKDHGGIGRLGAGPACAWKNFDYGMACDYACAAAWEMNVENRILGTFGLVSFALGYLEDVTATVALALGPAVELWWYNRPSLARWRDQEHISEMFRRNYAHHYQMFSSDLRPRVKQDGAWWEEAAEYVRIETDPEYSEYQQRIQGMLFETVLEVRPKVDAMKANLRSV
jgi:uncharacterized ferredoxin-like protein